MEQIKKHNGYIVPFDIPSESLKKGDILRKKTVGGDIDMFENIVILNSSYCLPPEWVETWEKYYQEEVKQVTAVNYLIHSIHEDMFQLSKSEVEWKEIFEQAKAMENKTDIQQLIDRNYAAQVKRGQITPETIPYKFVEKLYEELNELDNEIYDIDDWVLIPNEKAKKELIDIMLVCFSMAKHFGIDWQQVMTDKVEFNEKRED